VAVLVVAFGSGLTGGIVAEQAQSPTQATRASTAVAPVTKPVSGSSVSAVAAAVQPSVVSLLVQGSDGQATGSGIVLSADGTVLTNNHVIEGALDGGRITVAFSDGSTARASVVGREASADLAVVKVVDASRLTPATLGTSKDLAVGDGVVAIGSPLGLEGSVTSGIVSALHRSISTAGEGQGSGSESASDALGDAIQTDAAINPGNSGGALVDLSGRVIGVTTAIATLNSGQSQSGSIGLGFAIPIDKAQQVVAQILAS
jgi:putative serine protease PepD